MISKDEIKIDKTRTSKRLGFGWAETPCNSHRHFTGVPCNEHNAFYPRMNASHFSPYAPMFLNNLMPILSSCYDAIKVSWKKEFPDLIDPISKLESYTNQLPFPHDLVLKLNSDGVPYLVTRNMDCITATRCCSRLSIALSAGKNCQLDLLKRVQVQYSNIEEKTILKVINENSHRALHRDSRDIGAGGKPMFQDPFLKSGIEHIGCDESVIQFVTIISKNLNDNDSIFSISMADNYPVFTLKSPMFVKNLEDDNTIRCTVYGMDYSEKFHGNISNGLSIADNSWALRITSYVTVHTSSWSNWVKSLKNNEATQFLSMISGKSNLK